MEFSEVFETSVNGCKKADLLPGMQVRNRLSEKTGELVAKPGEENLLAVCGDNAVVVRVAFKGKRRRRITTWTLCNIIVL